MVKKTIVIASILTIAICTILVIDEIIQNGIIKGIANLSIASMFLARLTAVRYEDGIKKQAISFFFASGLFTMVKLEIMLKIATMALG